MADGKSAIARKKQGVLTGAIGFVLNILLGGVKLAVGLLSGSVSITGDAANNLSDAGSSMVTVGCFLLGGRKADRDHPYGHGRYEYIASLLIGAAIVLVGVEFAFSSVRRIALPTPYETDVAVIIVLSASIAVKCGMGVWYAYKARHLQAEALKAAATDSFSDCLVTACVFAGALLQRVVPPYVDGIVGLIVSFVIALSGIKLVMGTVGRLLGKNCPAETQRKLHSILIANPLVQGTHDLNVHDYGPNRTLATVHAEFDSFVTITQAHEVIDEMERRALAELDVELVVHCDPIDNSDENAVRLRTVLRDALTRYGDAGLHDLNVLYDERAITFHILVREEFLGRRQEIVRVLTDVATGVLQGFSVLVEMDVLYE